MGFTIQLHQEIRQMDDSLSKPPMRRKKSDKAKENAKRGNHSSKHVRQYEALIAHKKK